MFSQRQKRQAMSNPEFPDANEPLSLPENTGVVVIGRNEGARLVGALRKLHSSPSQCVYVDSGSIDDSVIQAQSLGIPVIVLDSSSPFTAARARNAGFEFLSQQHTEIEYVQFLDGDCVLASSWLAAGHDALVRDTRLAVVTGLLREVDADLSVYNRICSMEWDGPTGDIQTCGGIAMVRACAYREVGGMNPQLIAGEESDLHIRMRRCGWKLQRIPEVMAYHDADLTEFHQWWTRNLRAGHVCAEGAFVHGNGPERYKIRESRSNWFWGLVFPGVAAALSPVSLGLSAALAALGYGTLYARILRCELGKGRQLADAELYARYTVLGKGPQVLGQIAFHASRIRGHRMGLYEHKKKSEPRKGQRAPQGGPHRDIA